MQIITGKYRARKLISPEGVQTRPTLARVKESIFNIIASSVSGSTVLDLFAGSGAFGVECISRGASKVIFVDYSINAIKAIKVNTKNMTEDFEILQNDFKSALKELKNREIKFNLVMLDPPYKSNFTVVALELLEEYGLLSSDAKIIVEHEDANDLQNLSNYYIIKTSKKYGIAYVDVLEVR